MPSLVKHAILFQSETIQHLTPVQPVITSKFVIQPEKRQQRDYLSINTRVNCSKRLRILSCWAICTVVIHTSQIMPDLWQSIISAKIQYWAILRYPSLDCTCIVMYSTNWFLLTKIKVSLPELYNMVMYSTNWFLTKIKVSLPGLYMHGNTQKRIDSKPWITFNAVHNIGKAETNYCSQICTQLTHSRPL